MKFVLVYFYHSNSIEICRSNLIKGCENEENPSVFVNAKVQVRWKISNNIVKAIGPNVTLSSSKTQCSNSDTIKNSKNNSINRHVAYGDERYNEANVSSSSNIRVRPGTTSSLCFDSTTKTDDIESESCVAYFPAKVIAVADAREALLHVPLPDFAMEQEFFCLKSGSEKEKKSHDLTLHENEIGNEDAIQVKEESSSGLIACETILQVSEYEENRDKKGKQQYNLSLQEECLEASVEMEQMESSFKISGNAKELLLDLPQVKSASEEKPWLESESGEECHLVSEFTPQESQYNNAKIKQESSCEVVECDIILQVNENYDCEIIEQENCCLKEDDTRLSMKEVDSELEISDSVSQSSKVHRNWSFPFQALMAHRKRISQNEASKKYHCKECEFSTNVSTNLRRHLLTHTGERPYKCNICEKRFTQKRDLQQHNLFHTGEKPYNCKICGKKFTQGGTLKRHQVIHGGQKPFQCDICGKTFNISQNMKTHKKIHSQGKRYSCDTCGESFTVSSELAVHVKIHGDQRPYHCPHCELRFTWSGNLEKHVMAVHTHNYPYRCSQCNKGCMLLGHLKNHQRTIHGIE